MRIRVSRSGKSKMSYIMNSKVDRAAITSQYMGRAALC